MRKLCALVASLALSIQLSAAQECVFTLGDPPTEDCTDTCGSIDYQLINGDATDGSWFERERWTCHNSGVVVYCNRTYGGCPAIPTWTDPNGRLVCIAEYFSTPPNVLFPCA